MDPLLLQTEAYACRRIAETFLSQPASQPGVLRGDKSGLYPGRPRHLNNEAEQQKQKLQLGQQGESRRNVFRYGNNVCHRSYVIDHWGTKSISDLIGQQFSNGLGCSFYQGKCFTTWKVGFLPYHVLVIFYVSESQM